MNSRPFMRSFRVQLTALYLAFFSLLFVLFSVFIYGELSRSLTARLDETLTSEADTAAGLFPMNSGDEGRRTRGRARGGRRDEGSRAFGEHSGG